MDEFHYTTYSQEIIFGPGSFAQLSPAVVRRGWDHVLLCASGSAGRSGWLEQASTLLGSRLAAVYERVQPHVPEAQVAEAVALAQSHAVDAVIGLGGGSPLGMAKAVAAGLARQRGEAAPGAVARVPVAAIPTTYAGSEMTAIYGVTRALPDGPRKVTVNDPGITPQLVIYDPRLTLHLPADITAATGINAVAHCIEALYSITRHPLSTAAALGGLARISRALPRCHAAALDPATPAEQALPDRTDLLAGAHLAGASLADVAMGLHHGLCHVLGGSAGVPHGVANAIILPHAMRFNQDATAAQQAQAAEAMGLSRAGGDLAAAEAAARWVEALAAQMGLPRRLREAGLEPADLPRLAQQAFENRTVQRNPKPIRDAGQIAALLEAAW